MDYSSKDTTIEDLLSQVDDGRIGLPEFQRDFIWNPAKVVDLLKSLAKRWPAGSFLILEGPHSFASRPLKHAPPLLKTPEMLVLDGQQRLTGMYHAFRGTSEEAYYVDVKSLLEADADDDDYIKFMKREVFERRYPTLQSLASALILPITVIYEDDRFFEWLRFLDPDLQSSAVKARERKLSGLKKRIYRMPAVYLERDIDLAALAKIFETINRTGVRLDAFDLMTAALSPHNFNLRDQWNNALDEHEALLTTYDVNAIEILKLIALLEYLEKTENGERSTVKGVRQSDVLSLKPKIVISHWGKSINYYCAALDFVRSCGVLSSSLLPSESMLLTISACINVLSNSPIGNQKLRTWFWASCFQQQYSQGTNTQVISDSKALRSWLTGRGPVLPVITRNWVDDDTFFEQRRRNEILTRTIQCLLIFRGAKDWFKGHLLRDSNVPVELYHLVPKSELENSNNADFITNFIVSSSSHRLQKSGFLNDLFDGTFTPTDETLDSHCLGFESVENDDWLTFFRRRAQCFSSVVEREQAESLLAIHETINHEQY